MTFRELVPGAALPALVAAIVFGVGVLAVSRRRRSDAWLGVASGLAVAVAFAVGFLLVHRTWPSLPLEPSRDAGDWVAWVAVGALALGLLERGVPPRLRVPLRFAASFAAAWLVLAPHAGLDGAAKATRALVAAGGITVLWSVAAAAADVGRGPGVVVLPFAAATGVAAALFTLTAGSVLLGRTVGVLSTAALALVVLGFVLDRRVVSAGGAAVFALSFGVLLLAGHAYLNYGDVVYFPAASALLLLVAPAAGVATGVLAVRRGRGGRGLLAGVVPTLALSGLAWWLALRPG